MTLREKIELKKAVVAMDITDDGNLLTVDEAGNFREYSLSDYSIQNSLKTQIENQTWTKRISFSNDGEYLVYGLPDSSHIDVFSLSTKESIYSITKGYHQGNIVSTTVDNEGRYLLTTSEDGRAFLWNLKSGSTVFSFPKQSKAVNTSAFSRDGHIVATGTEEGVINLLNISTMEEIGSMENDDPIRGLLFLSDKYLLSVDKKNNIILWRYSDRKKIKTLIEYKSTITKIALSHDEHFLFVTTIKGKVLLYNLMEHKIVNQSYITLKNPITNISITGENGDIAISDTKGSIEFYSAHEDQELLGRYIKAKKYKEAYNLVENNDMLKFTKEYEVLELVWKTVLKKSKALLESELKDTIKVELMLEPFTADPEKRDLIHGIISDFKEYAKLTQFISTQNYHLAYDVARKHPSLEKTKSFRKLESIWQDHFIRAKMKLFEQGGEEKARTILSKFAGVTEKAFTIKNLFLQKNIYLQFQHLLKQGRYNQLLALVKQHQFLETNRDFQRVIDRIDDSFIQMRVAVKDGDFDLALDKAKFLMQMDDYKKEAQETTREVKSLQEFQTILKRGDIAEILDFAEDKPYLDNHPKVQELNERWDRVVFDAQEHASHGEIDAIITKLKEFYPVKVRYRKMANIFKIAYLSDLHNTITDNEDNLEFVLPLLARGIDNYLTNFGKDQEIGDLIETVEDKSGKSLNISHLNIGNIDNWTPDMVKDSILDKQQ
jgi:hypothetical protein